MPSIARLLSMTRIEINWAKYSEDKKKSLYPEEIVLFCPRFVISLTIKHLELKLPNKK